MLSASGEKILITSIAKHHLGPGCERLLCATAERVLQLLGRLQKIEGWPASLSGGTGTFVSLATCGCTLTILGIQEGSSKENSVGLAFKGTYFH